jgi:hypothetical protein
VIRAFLDELACESFADLSKTKSDVVKFVQETVADGRK